MARRHASGKREGEGEDNFQNEPPTLVADFSAEALGLKDSEVGLVQRSCRAAFAPFIRSVCLRALWLGSMRRIGSHTLAKFLLPVVRRERTRCGRAERYALVRLIERFGADAALPDVLMDLAARERGPNQLKKRSASRLIT
jgi:hypothetical protein